MSEDLDTIEDSPRTSVTKEQLEQRVRDWKYRLDALFQDIGDWAEKNGWRVDAGHTVEMREDIMEQFDVPATTQPVLRLDREDRYALFKPKALWVIGANGRINLYTSKGTFVIVDLAEPGSLPRWTIFRPGDKHNAGIFKREMIADLV